MQIQGKFDEEVGVLNMFSVILTPNSLSCFFYF